MFNGSNTGQRELENRPLMQEESMDDVLAFKMAT